MIEKISRVVVVVVFVAAGDATLAIAMAKTGIMSGVGVVLGTLSIMMAGVLIGMGVVSFTRQHLVDNQR